MKLPSEGSFGGFYYFCIKSEYEIYEDLNRVPKNEISEFVSFDTIIFFIKNEVLQLKINFMNIIQFL